jgi:ribosomal protein S17E
MTAKRKFLKAIRESAEADLPTKSSDASSELPDSLGSKVGSRAVKKELDGKKIADAAGTAKTVASEEVEDDKLNEDENDLPTNTSAAKKTVPDALDEEEDELKLSEEDEDSEAVTEEEDEKAVSEEDEDKAVSEEEEDEKKAVAESDDADADDKAVSEEEEDAKEVSEEEDEVKLSEEDEEKLAAEEEEDVKEAADAITKDENLPESFKRKVASIFEAAVKRTAKRRTDAFRAKLAEAYNKKLTAKKNQISETLVNKVDGYLDYVVEEWMKQNEVAIESSLRSTVTEKFIVGLKGLFESHYIDIPAEKTDVVSQQEKKIAALEKELNEELTRSVELRKENVALKKATIIKKHTEGLTVSDASKFAELCEGVSFDSAKAFSQKLQVIKETYFPKSPRKSGDLDASLLTEGGLEHEETSPVTGVDVYAQTISRMVKR